MSPTIDIIPGDSDLLGESSIWDDAAQCLYWVDSIAPRIRRFEPSTGRLDAWPMPLPVGSIGLTGRTGHLVAALKDGFYDIDLATGSQTLLARPEPGDPAARFNDGKVDRQGRFVSGTLVPHGAVQRGHLYRLNHDITIDHLDSGAQISNALSFGLDGRTMYYADSLQRAIWAFDYDPATGAATGKRVLIDTAPLHSAPDGACVDAAGCLWVAMVEIGRVARITPAGAVDRMISVPAEFPTCPAFGGPGLTALYVTSIRDSGSGRMIGKRPESGKVMAITGLGISGVPEPRFTGLSPDN